MCAHDVTHQRTPLSRRHALLLQQLAQDGSSQQG
jgi:hypothetical protein